MRELSMIERSEVAGGPILAPLIPLAGKAIAKGAAMVTARNAARVLAADAALIAGAAGYQSTKD